MRSIVFDLSRRIRWPVPPAASCATVTPTLGLGREIELEARMEEVSSEYAAARERGDFDIAGVIAGESCALIHDIPPAGEIVERTCREAERLIRAQATGFGQLHGRPNV